ncbi:MAG: RluA family pseudouridine synthase [Bryobacteraceae bacterium]
MIPLQADPTDARKRLDHFLQEKLPAYSRSRIQAWITAGRVLVDGKSAKASAPLRGGERIEVEPAEPPLDTAGNVPEDGNVAAALRGDVNPLHADPTDARKRLDHYLQEKLPAYSRSRIQSWITAGRVLVDGKPAKASAPLRGGERIEVEPAEPPPLHAFAEDLPLRVLYEDAAVLAVDKPAGMVVHVGAGAHSGTLVNALLHRFRQLSTAGGAERPGIVHRLDRDTSGVILIARTDAAHRALAEQFASREVEKEYLALVQGRVRLDHGRVDAPIERDSVRRTRMTCRTGRGRSALTEYWVLGRSPEDAARKWSYLRVRIHTGRTHQIRVHLASLGHPVAGDTLYGATRDPELPRFFLHAHRIAFTSPVGGRVEVVSPLPEDLARVLAARVPLQ